jgi:hypothetical protein
MIVVDTKPKRLIEFKKLSLKCPLREIEIIIPSNRHLTLIAKSRSKGGVQGTAPTIQKTLTEAFTML